MRILAIVAVLFTAVVGVFPSPVVERKTSRSVAVVLTDLTNTVMPLVDQLFYSTAENATQAILMPIVSDISTAMTDAVSSLKLLTGQPTNVILAAVDDTTVLTASDIATVLASVVHLIFKAVGAVLAVVDSTNSSTIKSLLVTLGQVVFSLLFIVLSLDAGILSPLLPLLVPVFSIISDLGLTNLLTKLIGGLLSGL